MSNDWGDNDDPDWDDWPDDGELGPGPSDGPNFGPPALVAVFEDGPLDKPTLAIAGGLSNWPPAYGWIAADASGAACSYIYKHDGNGHYRVALTRRLDV